MFGWIKKLFGALVYDEDIEDEYEEGGEKPLSRDDVDLSRKEERSRYIQGCVDQVKDARYTLDDLSREYAQVTGHLTDMEELEALPPAVKKEIVATAEKIAAYEKEKDIREKEGLRMKDSEFRRVQNMEAEIKEGIERISETEDYQDKIHMDMRRLTGEHHAFKYRKKDLKLLLANLRGMIIITAFAFVTCMIILLMLQHMMNMDIRVGYILTSSATALAAFFIYLRYNEALKERRRIEQGINKLILLQNRVKIRYVNNTNLLEYLYVKYNVESGKQLRKLWEDYQVEREERLKLQELYADLDFYQKELMRLMNKLPLKYPQVWLRQADAIGNKNEMLEIRHNLILRRQKLRQQMDYNDRLAADALAQLKSLIEEFPLYSPEVIELAEVNDIKLMEE